MAYGDDPTAPPQPTPPITATVAPDLPPPGTPAPQPPQAATPFPGLVPDLLPKVQRESGGQPSVGYTPPGKPLVDLSKAPLDDTGFPIWDGNIDPQTGLRSHAAGILQIQPGTWRPIAQKLGIKDFSLESQIKVGNELYKEQGLKPWATTGGYGRDPVIGAGNWNVAPEAVAFEQNKKDTSVVYMAPDDYLQMTPALAPDKALSRSLSRSLALGDDIDAIPTLDVKRDGDDYKVVDQDGRRRALAAKEAGVDLIPVAVHGATGETAKQIIGMGGQVKPFDFKPVPKVEEKPSLFSEGVRTMVGGATQAVTHALPTKWVDAVNQFNNFLADEGVPLARVPEGGVDEMERKRMQELVARRGPTETLPEVAGEFAAMLPMAYLAPETSAGLVPRLVAAAGMGAAGGVMSPVTDGGDFWKEKGEQALIGAATGGALGAGGEAVSRLVAPNILPAAQRLLAAGVRLTPGQMLGGAARGIENRLTSIIPTASGAIKRSIEDFNRVAYDKVLSRIGKAFEGNKVGYDGINAVEKEISKEYNRILSPLHVKVDDQFVADMNSLRELASEMPRDEARQFAAILKNRVVKRMGPEGAMDGRTFKAVESELSEISRRLRRSDVEGQRQLGTAVDQINAMLRENLERQNPQAAAELRRANGAWAAFVRIRDAATNRASSLGIFTPSDLLTATKRAAGRRVFARGDALMQDLARDAQEVLPNNVPDSGTATRLLMGELIGGVGAGILHPGGFGTIAAGLGTLGTGLAAYTAPGVSLLRGAAGAGMPGVRNFLAKSIRSSVPAVAPTVGMTYTMPSPQPLPQP